jgi:sulfur-carrier protein
MAATVAELVAGMEPALAAELNSERVRVAVNGALAARTAPLSDGDEVAFLPPVSGG